MIMVQGVEWLPYLKWGYIELLGFLLFVVAVGISVEDDGPLVLSLRQPALSLLVRDDVDSPEAVVHVVFCGAHCVVVIEQHARQLIVGGLYHLRFLYEAAPEDDRSRVDCPTVERFKVTLFTHHAEVSWAMLPFGGEPGEWVAIEVWPDLKAMDMGGNWN